MTPAPPPPPQPPPSPAPPQQPWTSAPPPPSTPPYAGSGGDAPLSGLIPYKNTNALVSYYLGIFSILPLIGLPMAIVALVLGIKGLKHAKANPAAKGGAHAWTGIITGVLFGLFNAFLVGLIILAFATRSFARASNH